MILHKSNAYNLKQTVIRQMVDVEAQTKHGGLGLLKVQETLF